MPRGFSEKLVWVYCSILLSAVFGGAGFVFMKGSLAVFSAAWFTFWRFFLSAAILFPFLAKKSWRAPHALKDGFVVGFLFCVATLVQLEGIARTDAGRSAFINSASMVIVPILQSLQTRRIPTLKTVVGCLLCLSGVAFLSLQKMTGRADGKAELLVFAGTCLFACQLVVFKRAVQRNDPAVLSFVEFSVIALLSLPAALLHPLPLLEGGRGWGGIFYSAVMMNIVMIMASNNALRYIPPTNVAVIGSTQAIYGAIFGSLLLGEALTRQFVFSGSLIFSGIIVVILSAPASSSSLPSLPPSPPRPL
ncbi:MAG: DMT family transporter [Synergistaceae bacterium]|nr:DMT family transporter [Synergistaceae bacterium]